MEEKSISLSSFIRDENSGVSTNSYVYDDSNLVSDVIESETHQELIEKGDNYISLSSTLMDEIHHASYNTDNVLLFGAKDGYSAYGEILINLKEFCLDKKIGIGNIEKLEVVLFGEGNEGEAEYYINSKYLNPKQVKFKNGVGKIELDLTSNIKNTIRLTIYGNENNTLPCSFTTAKSIIRVAYIGMIKHQPNSDSLTDDSKLENEFGGNPSVNLLTGIVHYEFPDLIIGLGKYKIPIIHTYNSKRYGHSDCNKYGNGWNLNIGGKIVVSSNNYKYIDSKGYVHSFFKMLNSTSDEFYSLEGMILRKNYVEQGKTYYRLDGRSSKEYTLYNENTGRLEKIINKNIGETITIYWTDGYPFSIVSEKGGYRYYLDFNDGKLTKLQGIKGDEVTFENIVYEYEDNNLIRVIKKNWRNEKTIHEFSYCGGGLLYQGIKNDAKTYFRIKYDESRRANVLSEGHYQNDTFKESNRNILYYENKETLIEGKNGKSIFFQFDDLRKMTSSFYKDSIFDNKLYTSDKVTGTTVSSDDTSSNEIINGKGLFKNEVKLRGTVERRQGENDFVNYTAKGCIKLLDDVEDIDVWIKIEYTHRTGSDSDAYQEYYKREKLNNKAQNKWQFFALSFYSYMRVIDGMKIYVEDGYGNEVKFECSTIEFVPTENMDILIGNKSYDELQKVSLYNSNNTLFRELPINYSTYFSLPDLLKTAESLIRKDDENYEPKVFYRAGTAIISSIYDLKLKIDDKVEKLLNSKKTNSGESYYESNVVLKKSSYDNKVTTKFKTNFYKDCIEKVVECKVSPLAFSSTSTKSKVLDYYGNVLLETDAYDVRTYYEYDSKKNLINIYRRKYSNGISNIDVIRNPNDGIEKEEIIESYKYDKFGKLIEEEGTNYNHVKNEHNEYRDIVENVSYDGYLFDENRYINGTAYGKINYDDFYERKTRIALENSYSECLLKNEIEYDGDYIVKANDGSSFYEINYDLINDEVKYYISDIDDDCILVQERNCVSDGESTKIFTRYYNDYNSVEVQNLDEYGRLNRIEEGYDCIDFEYRNIEGGNPSKRNVSRILEKNGCEHIFGYNYDNELCNYRSVYMGNSFEIHKISSYETMYTFSEAKKYISTTKYDENKLLDSRIRRTYCYDKQDGKEEYNTFYSYDELGRLNKKSIINDDSITGGNFNSEEKITYLNDEARRTISLIKSQDFKRTSSFDSRGDNITSISYSYNSKGMISEEVCVNKYNKTTNNLGISSYDCELKEIKKYEYDDINRIIKEVYKRDDYNSEESFISYGENEGPSFGKIERVTKGGIKKNYSYDKYGRLISVTYDSKTENKVLDDLNVNITYDKYGNIKLIGSSAFSYKKGNLLNSIKYDTNKKVEYLYNYNNIRFSKEYSTGERINYFLDGNKIIGEDRINTRNEGRHQLLYFYDATGLAGFSYDSVNYWYYRDIHNNILGIVDKYGNVIVRYTYDIFGNTLVYDGKGNVIEDKKHIGHINPFRWKSHYYDVETGLYSVNGRYYSPELGIYLDAQEASAVTVNASALMMLNRQGIGCLSYLDLESYGCTISDVMQFKEDISYEKERTWIDLSLLFIILRVITAVFFFMTQNWGGLLGMAVGTVLSKLNEHFGTAFELLGLTIQLIVTMTKMCNPIALGISAILLCMNICFITFEIYEGITGRNPLKESIGEPMYQGLLFAVTIATALMNFIGPKLQCFKEGTLVKTKDGKKAIEEIKEGDYVYAYDEVKKEYAYKKVISLSRNVTKKWCYVSLIINGKKETIVSTPGHKYYVPCNNSNRDNNEILEHDSYKELSNKWVSAYLLRCGDKVLLSDGSYGIIDSVIVEDLINDEVTYNFEVEDYHTYFVGEYSVCVHNARCGVIEQQVPDGYEPTYENGVYEANPKHGMSAHGKASAGLATGYDQYALDNAISTGYGKGLYSYNGKDIIQFMPTNSTTYHGFVVGGINNVNNPRAASVLRRLWGIK